MKKRLSLILLSLGLLCSTLALADAAQTKPEAVKVISAEETAKINKLFRPLFDKGCKNEDSQANKEFEELGIDRVKYCDCTFDKFTAGMSFADLFKFFMKAGIDKNKEGEMSDAATDKVGTAAMACMVEQMDAKK
jgi:hypothetical protein